MTPFLETINDAGALEGEINIRGIGGKDAMDPAEFQRRIAEAQALKAAQASAAAAAAAAAQQQQQQQGQSQQRAVVSSPPLATPTPSSAAESAGQQQHFMPSPSQHQQQQQQVRVGVRGAPNIPPTPPLPKNIFRKRMKLCQIRRDFY